MQALELKGRLESWLEGEDETPQQPRVEEWSRPQENEFTKRRLSPSENCEYTKPYNETDPTPESEARQTEESKPYEIKNLWTQMQKKWDWCEWSLKVLAPAAVAIAHTAENQKSISEQFGILAKTWKKETKTHFALPAIVMHPAYLDIIGMGKAAIPLILHELKRSPDHWFTALRAIAKTSPVRPEDAGDIAKMRNAWLKWGKEHDYLD